MYIPEERRKPEYPEKEYKTKTKLNPHLTPGSGNEPRTHWWEASALIGGRRERCHNLVPRASFPLPSGRQTRALGATISGMRHRCRCAVNRLTRIRLFPLFFQNVCSQSSRFPSASQRERNTGNEIGATLSVLFVAII